MRTRHSASIVLIALMLSAVLTPPAAAQGPSRGGGQQTNYVAWSTNSGALVLVGPEVVWLYGVNDPTEPPRTLDLQEERIFCAAFHPSGDVLAVGSEGGVVFWNTAPWYSVGTLDIGTTTYLAYSPDWARLATVGWSNDVQVWNTATYEEVHRLAGHTDYVTSVAFSPDGTQLVSGGRDGTVRVWNMESGEQIVVLEGHSDWVSSVTFASEGDWVVSASKDATVRVWDAASGAEVITLPGDAHGFSSVAAHPSQNDIAAGDGSAVWVWRLDDVPGSLEPRALLFGAAESVAYAPDGSWLAAGGGATGFEYADLWRTDHVLLSPPRE